MKEIMQDSNLKPHGKYISQTVSKILKNVGKFSKFSLSTTEELSFFNDIKSVIEKKYNCAVEIIIEKESEEKKAVQALPGKPAIIIL